LKKEDESLRVTVKRILRENDQSRGQIEKTVRKEGEIYVLQLRVWCTGL